jgi:hypothetical protein
MRLVAFCVVPLCLALGACSPGMSDSQPVGDPGMAQRSSSSGAGSSGSSSGNPMEPKKWSDEDGGLVGSWVGVFEWGAAEATGGAASIKMTHRFASSLRSGAHHYGIYRYVEEVSDIPKRGCRRVTDRGGSYDFDGKLLVVTLTEGTSSTRCPGAANSERAIEGESKQSYDAEVSGDLLALRSIVTGGVSVSPVVFKREAP